MKERKVFSLIQAKFKTLILKELITPQL